MIIEATSTYTGANKMKSMSSKDTKRLIKLHWNYSINLILCYRNDIKFTPLSFFRHIIKPWCCLLFRWYIRVPSLTSSPSTFDCLASNHTLLVSDDYLTFHLISHIHDKNTHTHKWVNGMILKGKSSNIYSINIGLISTYITEGDVVVCLCEKGDSLSFGWMCVTAYQVWRDEVETCMCFITTTK